MMDWEECCTKRIAKSVKPDVEMIQALRKSSENKLHSERELSLSDITASSKLSLAYDSLRELLEALALTHGFKIYNHECYTAFLKEVMHTSDLGDDFDDLRKVRNDVNYYGKAISQEEATTFIQQIQDLRAQIVQMLDT